MSNSSDLLIHQARSLSGLVDRVSEELAKSIRLARLPRNIPVRIIEFISNSRYDDRFSEM